MLQELQVEFRRVGNVTAECYLRWTSKELRYRNQRWILKAIGQVVARLMRGAPLLR